MDLKRLLGSDIVHELNVVKKLFSPEYEKYWHAHITPLVQRRMKELKEQAEELSDFADFMDYNLRLAPRDYRLDELLDKMGYKRGY